MSSAPPPPGGGAGRTHAIQFETGRKLSPDALRLTPAGASLEIESLLREPLKLTLGQLHLGNIDRGPGNVRGPGGRFPSLGA